MSMSLLLKLRKQRIERLMTELQHAKTAVKIAQEAVEQAETEFSDYKMWRVKEEKSMFNALHGGNFSADKMRGYNATLDRLKEKQIKLEGVIPERKIELEKSIQTFDSVQKKLQEATKKKEKIDEFLKVEEEQELKVEEMVEEEVIDELNCFQQYSSK